MHGACDQRGHLAGVRREHHAAARAANRGGACNSVCVEGAGIEHRHARDAGRSRRERSACIARPARTPGPKHQCIGIGRPARRSSAVCAADLAALRSMARPITLASGIATASAIATARARRDLQLAGAGAQRGGAPPAAPRRASARLPPTTSTRPRVFLAVAAFAGRAAARRAAAPASSLRARCGSAHFGPAGLSGAVVTGAPASASGSTKFARCSAKRSSSPSRHQRVFGDAAVGHVALAVDRQDRASSRHSSR